jgi:CYTH domain-containing protein
VRRSEVAATGHPGPRRVGAALIGPAAGIRPTSVQLVLSNAADWTREPGRGKYARSERERRFLVKTSVPAGEAARLIEDRYLDGMRLRLRRVSRDGWSVHKLTQKVRPDASDPSQVLITNMYLSETEYSRLSALPGQLVVKTRVVIPVLSHDFVVDEFHGRLQGLRLAEVEVRDLAEPLDLPGWVTTEVTSDDRFSGGQLATTTAVQLRELLDT